MDDHDDDLARAIAISLKESQKQQEVIVVDSDDDQDDDEKRFQNELRQVLEASKADSSLSQPSSRSESSRASAARHSPSPPLPPPHAAPASGFLSQRAQMEKERLERQRRLRGDTMPNNVHQSDDDAAGISDDEPAAKRKRLFASNAASSSRTFASPAIGSDHPDADQLFWSGELRQVANRHADPSDNRPKFTLTDVLSPKSEVAFAIISSYVASVSWVYQFFDPSVPVIFVSQPDSSGNADIKNILPNWIRTTAFLRNGYGCMHMKTMWVQDVPKLSSPRTLDPKATEDFPILFERVLHAVNVKPALTSFLRGDHPNLPLQSIENLSTHWDWSKVTAQLVASIAGKHEGWTQVLYTGHPRLMKAVRNMGLRTGKTLGSKQLTLECQGSSIGVYTTQWMNEFYWSARGESAENWLTVSKKRRESAPYPPIKVLFPSLQTVRQSVLGERVRYCAITCRSHLSTFLARVAEPCFVTDVLGLLPTSLDIYSTTRTAKQGVF
ncbi:hypothetical protein HGRIS_006571 [Hohenbuehelia grisea]|uniref:Uncharacterized protein n=1 Tax=Hohenbuehelia grisea TaxID=104357 RepID=A0ABR3J9Q4_9AGAR